MDSTLIVEQCPPLSESKSLEIKSMIWSSEAFCSLGIPVQTCIGLAVLPIKAKLVSPLDKSSNIHYGTHNLLDQQFD